MQFKLVKNDSSDIDFAVACLMAHAIHLDEFKDWLYFVIERTENPPSYFFDMLDVKLLLDFKPTSIMGWHSEPELTNEEWIALDGIAFKRGIRSFEDGVSRKQAIAQLQANPALYKRVKDFFPFVDFETVVGPDPDKGW